MVVNRESIFILIDFGGQSIFNDLHKFFFLEKCGSHITEKHTHVIENRLPSREFKDVMHI